MSNMRLTAHQAVIGGRLNSSIEQFIYQHARDGEEISITAHPGFDTTEIPTRMSDPEGVAAQLGELVRATNRCAEALEQIQQNRSSLPDMVRRRLLRPAKLDRRDPGQESGP